MLFDLILNNLVRSNLYPCFTDERLQSSDLSKVTLLPMVLLRFEFQSSGSSPFLHLMGIFSTALPQAG